MHTVLVSLALAVLALTHAVAAGAAVTWTKVYSGLTQPVDIVGARDGSGRLFVAQQTGQIRVIKNGVLLPVPLLNLAGSTGSSGEQGLLGLVFHPQFATNRQFFVNFTRTIDGATVIARYTVPAGSDVADAASGQVLLLIAQPYSNHNGGAMRFGADGFLYIGMGDGGSGNDPEARAQDKATLLGKILRIDVDHGNPYAIPPGNPWASGVGGLPEIFAIGLRNPWRFSFDRTTGDFWIGDVGQGAVEEIDLLPAGTGAGANLGWRVMEGNVCTGLSGPVACNDPSLTMPVLTYTHSFGCSVTGGYVYRGAQVTLLAGRYIYGDYCSGRLWAASKVGGVWTPTQLADTSYQISAFGEDDAGELYFTDYSAGDIYKFTESAPPTSPVLSLSSPSVSFGSVVVGTSVSQTLTVTNTGGGTLSLMSLTISASALKGVPNTEFQRSGTCAVGTALAATQSCTVVIQFTPPAAGGRSGTLAIMSNAGSPSVPLSGTGTVGTMPPQLAASTTTLNFGTVALGGSATQSLTLRNAGGGTLTLGTFTPGGANAGDFARSGTCAPSASLTAGQTCTVIYQFTPTAAAARTASLAVASNGGSVTVNLAGIGSTTTSGPVLGVGSTSLSFGSVSVGQSSATQTVTVSNAGSGLLTLASLSPGGTNSRDFPNTGTCSTKSLLSVGQSCSVVFRFAPTATGTRSGTFAITSNGGAATISLGGTGI